MDATAVDPCDPLPTRYRKATRTISALSQPLDGEPDAQQAELHDGYSLAFTLVRHPPFPVHLSAAYLVTHTLWVDAVLRIVFTKLDPANAEREFVVGVQVLEDDVTYAGNWPALTHTCSPLMNVLIK